MKQFGVKGNICPACNGEKVQRRKDGMLDNCPACGGTGVRNPRVEIVW